jgi:hypothetical protein
LKISSKRNTVKLQYAKTSNEDKMTQKILTRDFVLAFFAQFAFLSVFYLLIPTLPIFLSRSGSTETEIGVLIGIFFFSSLVLRPFVARGLLKIHENNL